MSAEPAELTELRRRAGEIADLGGIGGLLLWDQNTMMPPGGADARADQFEALERILHDRITDPALAQAARRARVLRGERRPGFRRRGADPQPAARPAQGGQRPDRARGGDLQCRRARAAGLDGGARGGRLRALPAGARARSSSSPTATSPASTAGGEFAHPYDVLLDDYEPSLTTAEVKGIFATIQEELVPLVSAAAAAGEDGRVFPGHFPQDAQQGLADELLRAVGYDPEHWRLDPAVHPFARSMAAHRRAGDDALGGGRPGDGPLLLPARVRARALRGADGPAPLPHDAGGGDRPRRPRVAVAPVGEPRRPLQALLRVRAPAVSQATSAVRSRRSRSPGSTATSTRSGFSLIRIEADETTYNLHIALRFELELALVEGRLAVKDLPEAWNEATYRLLGLETPSLKEGVLQDIHWGTGMIGYFPTYTIGNLMSAQLWRALSADLPEIDASIAAGDFAPLREWLRDNIHSQGRKYTSRELLRARHGGGTAGRPVPRVPRGQVAGCRVADRPGPSSPLLAGGSNTSSHFPSAAVVDWRAVLCPLARTPSSSRAPVSTTSRTSPSSCRVTRSSSSPACRVRASPRSPSTPSMPRASAATSSR